MENLNNNTNEPVKHHIIPQTYLRNFQDNDGNLFACKIQSDYKARIRKTSAAGECFEPNYYKISEPENPGEELIVEKIINQSFERDIPKYFSLLTSGSSEISIADKCRIAEIIIHLKMRNPFVRELVFKPEVLTAIMDLTATDFKTNPDEEVIAAAESIGLSTDEYLDLVKIPALIRTNRDGGAAAHNEFIINQAQNNSIFKSSNLWRMVQGEWRICSFPDGLKVLTSDNPGVSITGGQSFQISFEGKFEYIFPISPNVLLSISKPGEIDLASLRTLKKVTITAEELSKVNSAIAVNANEQIYADNHDVIDKTRDDVIQERYFTNWKKEKKN